MFRCIRYIAPLILSVPLSAIAVPPQSEQFVDVGFALIPSIDCDSFLITFDMESEKARITTFFDESGNAIRMRVRWTYHGTATNSLTGLTLRDQSALNITTDLSANTTTIVGVGFHYAIPGRGLIFVEAGKLIVGPDGSFVFQAGQHDATTGFDLLCEAIAA